MMNMLDLLLWLGVFAVGTIIGGAWCKESAIADLLKKDTYCESTKVQGKEFKRCWAITELDQ